MSPLEDADVERVRAHFTHPVKKAEKPAPEKKVLKEKTESPVRKEVPDSEAPKKKKPVLLFRPENSSLSRPAKPVEKAPVRKPEATKPKEKKPQPAEAREPQRRTVIKPSVPTTAEQYKEYARDEQKPAPVKPVRKPKEVREEIPEAAAVIPEAAAVPVPEIIAEPAPAAPAAVSVPETVTEAPAPSASAEEKASSAEPAAKEAAGEPSKEVPEEKVPKSREEKPLPPAKPREAVKAEEKPVKKPAERPERKPASREGAPIRRSGEGMPERPERRPAGDRPERTRRPAGTGTAPAERAGNRTREDRPGGSIRRSGAFAAGGQTGTRPGPRGTGTAGTQGAPGRRPAGAAGTQQRSGSFGRPGSRPQGGAASAVPDKPGFSKADVRGVKTNKNDKKNTGSKDRDKNDKRAENFRNLSKNSELKKKPQQVKKEEEVIKMIILPEVITIRELAENMKPKPADIVKKLFLQGKMVTVNSELSYEEAEEVALSYEILCEQEEKVDVIEELLREDEEDEALMKKRPPVVCVMGHVDHGKTSLLDAIRETNVTAREAGGITQHIGAYMVELKGEKITFLDTPGHEAFTAMRMRGAQATDIAVLVVAADDGVMPQTVEAINHAKAAGVEIIVAVNKIDKPAANVDRVKTEMSEYGLVPEDWGGSTIFVPVSAKTRVGIDDLLENILLVTEVMELRANPNREVRGIVIEAKLDKGRGPVATVLVQKGTLHQGDFVSCGSFYGRVRAMLDSHGVQLKTATPSTPVEILGLNGAPNAGEVCGGHTNEREARSYAETFIAEEKKKMLAETKTKLTMDSLFAEIQAGNIKELPIIVKADVQGSVEAVRQSLEKLSNEEVSVKVIHGAVGAINESDVTLASASNAIIIGFNIKADNQARMLAESEHVDLRLYRVIYQAIDDVEAAMKGMLAPVYEEKILGHAEIRMTFKASGVGVIAGAYVLDGTFERGAKARITRDKEQIFDGPIASLRRFKDDVREVREGFECGIVFEKFNDLQEGDIIEAYKMVEVARE